MIVRETAVQTSPHPSLCRCVLGQNTLPTLPHLNVSDCSVVVIGAFWCRVAVRLLSLLFLLFVVVIVVVLVVEVRVVAVVLTV